MEVRVDGHDVSKALTVFKEASGMGWPDAKVAFKRLVHIKTFGRYIYLMNEEDANRVRLMGGKNGYVICKMLLARAS